MRFASLLITALVVIVTATASLASAQDIALKSDEILLQVYMFGADRSDIDDIRTKLVAAIETTAERIKPYGIQRVGKSETMFQYILNTVGDSQAATILAALNAIPDKASLGIARMGELTTTAAAGAAPEESSMMRTILIIGGAFLCGIFIALIVAAVCCKPRSTEAEERRQREKQQEQAAKVEAEMQVQHLVRSAAFQRLQERVIDLEKEESVRQAVGEVEDTAKANRRVAKTVARELMSEPFIEPEARLHSAAAVESDRTQTLISEPQRRLDRATDRLQNATRWWHDPQLQAEIVSDLGMPRYSGIAGAGAFAGGSADEDEQEAIEDELLAATDDPAVVARLHHQRMVRRRETRKIPDRLIDHTAASVLGQGKHWAAHITLPKINPKIASLVMLAKSNLHGLGVFARRFIDRGTTLFTWANPSQVNNEKHIYTANEMRFHFGVNWDSRLHFVARDGLNKKFCVAEAPRERGWGCLINSARGSGSALVANCECVFPDDRRAGLIPWVRVTQTIAPLGELLLDYPFPELIQRQRGLDPDDPALDEPPPPAISAYGLADTLPLMSTVAAGAAAMQLSSSIPRPRQNMELPPPPPPDEADAAPPPPPAAGDDAVRTPRVIQELPPFQRRPRAASAVGPVATRRPTLLSMDSEGGQSNNQADDEAMRELLLGSRAGGAAGAAGAGGAGGATVVNMPRDSTGQQLDI